MTITPSQISQYTQNLSRTPEMLQIESDKSNEFEEFIRAFRLIGRTVFLTRGKHVEMRFETFYGG